MFSEEKDVQQLIAEIQEALESDKNIEEAVATIHVGLLASQHFRKQIPIELFVKEMQGWKTILQKIVPLLKELDEWKHLKARADAMHRAQLVHDIINKHHPITETSALQIVHDVYKRYQDIEVAIKGIIQHCTEKRHSS